MLRLIMVLCCSQIVWAASASEFHNEKGSYSVNFLPDATIEQKRMNSFRLSDQQPLGRFVEQGEKVEVNVEGLSDDLFLAATVGFHPMWDQSTDQQEEPLHNGKVKFTARQNGPLFFKLTSASEDIQDDADVKVSVTGGMPLPLYVEGQTSTEDWNRQLAAYANAPFVQLLSKRSMITLPMADHNRHPITDPHASFEAIDKIIEMEDELAGFDSSTPRDVPSPLRRHFLVDFMAPADAPFYMYATDESIGLRPNSFTDLTDPARLEKAWGIWHELGHTYQQKSWTWEGVDEVTVNLFSLYVQEKKGQLSRLSIPNDDGKTPRLEAIEYVKKGSGDFMSAGEPFVKLVMFEQLKDAYGWDLFTKTFRYYREQPQSITDAHQAADAFIKAMCQFSGNDLRLILTNGVCTQLKAQTRISKRFNSQHAKTFDRR
ncbi:M60 family metallopeptidase [Brucella sp. 21LCYQ03]|nr:M60 family metallopeptidase [Brucella sp. 21LCYQ03]